MRYRIFDMEEHQFPSEKLRKTEFLLLSDDLTVASAAELLGYHDLFFNFRFQLVYV